jgi:hypothetical protein
VNRQYKKLFCKQTYSNQLIVLSGENSGEQKYDKIIQSWSTTFQQGGGCALKSTALRTGSDVVSWVWRMPHPSLEATQWETCWSLQSITFRINPLSTMQCYVWQSNQQLLCISNFENVSIYTIKTAIVSMVASSVEDRWFDPDRVKPETIKLVFVISPISTKH